MRSPHEILKKYWGYDSFRPLQEDIIQSVLAGNDTLGLMPTGGGKSITFQVPGMIFDGITLVVTPIISLMKDQWITCWSAALKPAIFMLDCRFPKPRKCLRNVALGCISFYTFPQSAFALNRSSTNFG